MGILQLQNLNELKSIKFTIKILRMLIFHICNLESKWKDLSKQKHRKDLFTFGSKRNHTKKYQESKSFYCKKHIFINWFI